MCPASPDTRWALGTPELPRSFNTPNCCRHPAFWASRGSGCGWGCCSDGDSCGVRSQGWKALMKTSNQPPSRVPQRGWHQAGAGGAVVSELVPPTGVRGCLCCKPPKGMGSRVHARRCGDRTERRASGPRPALGVGVPPAPGPSPAGGPPREMSSAQSSRQRPTPGPRA